jgi:hypothetical protein
LATKKIDRTIKWINRHKFINIQELWDFGVCNYEKQMAGLFDLMNQAIHATKTEDDNSKFSEDLVILEKHAIPLARSLIPILILSRLFFQKIARYGLHKMPLKPFTDMNSYQLGTLHDTTGFIARDLSEIIALVTGESMEYDRNNDTDIAKCISDSITKLIHRFNSNALLVIMYIMPLIPHSIPSPNDLHHFLLAWNKLFIIATQDCIWAAQE